MLALVQDALDEIRVAEVRTPLNPHVERWWREPRRELDARAAYASRQELADLEQILQDLDLGGLATLPTGLIHGDFHGRNLLFRGDEIVAVLDFDVVHTTVRSVDVARALLAFARPRRGSLEVRPKFAAAFLSRYECRRPLIDEEHTALPTLLTLVFMPRAEKCELLAAEGDDPAAWVTGRIKTVAEVAQRRAGLLKVIASVR